MLMGSMATTSHPTSSASTGSTVSTSSVASSSDPNLRPWPPQNWPSNWPSPDKVPQAARDARQHGHDDIRFGSINPAVGPTSYGGPAWEVGTQAWWADGALQPGAPVDRFTPQAFVPA
jgi:hypothetical protein